MIDGLPYLAGIVYLDDGRTFKFEADQRDQRRAMAPAPAGGGGILSPDMDPIGWNRASAWAYLVRTGELEMGWAEFDACCAFAQPAEVIRTVDPTPPASDE
jgi:hypothetical protein